MSPSEATEAYGYCSICGHLNNDLSACNCAGKTLQKVKWQPPTYGGKTLTCPTCGLTYQSNGVHTCTGIKGVSLHEALTKTKKLSIDDIVSHIDSLPDTIGTTVRKLANKEDLKPLEKQRKHVIEHCENLGIIPTTENSIRTSNIGKSDYSKHVIQPWSIWLEYNLNPWDADIIKRTLRTKEGDSRILDYEKIIHICQERIRQLTTKEPT